MSFHALGSVNEEMVGTDPDDGAVFVVPPLRIVGLHPADVLNRPRDAGSTLQERAWEGPERMEVEVVYDGRDLPENGNLWTL